jgi:hypothetical protein
MARKLMKKKREFEELKSIWRDVDNGKTDNYSDLDFFSWMKECDD